MGEAVAGIVHETQEYLCTLFIKAHGEDGDYEYALDAATLARLVRAAQRALS